MRAQQGTAVQLRPRPGVLVAVAAGGAVGSVGRWGLSQVVPVVPGGWPAASWIANVSGSCVLGTLMVLVIDVWPPSRYVRPFLAVGVLGGYTTFSAFMLETHGLLTGGQPARAAGYLVGTVVTGLLAGWLGAAGTRATVARTRRRTSSRSTASPPNRRRD